MANVMAAVSMKAAAWTAVGTIALAVMTLAAVVTTIGITITDRRRADARIAPDRKLATERRQAAEAQSVEVIPNVEYGGAVGVSCLAANVTTSARPPSPVLSASSARTARA